MVTQNQIITVYSFLNFYLMQFQSESKWLKKLGLEFSGQADYVIENVGLILLD